MSRRLLCAIVLAVVGAVVAAPTTAHAAAYRYWSYWYSNGTGPWTYSSMGAASRTPADQSVEGWRFLVSNGTASSSPPRTAGTFASLCPDLDSVAPDKKRIAVVLDYGTTSDAPAGQTPPGAKVHCLVTAKSANGAAVLAMATSVRTERGLVCGIGGYPSGECAPAIGSASAPKPNAATKSPSAAKKPATSGAAPTKAPAAATPDVAATTAAPSSAPAVTPNAATVPPSAAAQPAPDGANVADDVVFDRASNERLPTGSIVGVLVGLALIVGLAGFVVVRSRRKRP